MAAASFRPRLQLFQGFLLGVVIIAGLAYTYRNHITVCLSQSNDRGGTQRVAEGTASGGDEQHVPRNASGRKEGKAMLKRLGVLSSRRHGEWTPLQCDRSRKLRQVTVKAEVGNVTFYVYNSDKVDGTVTWRALHGSFFEKKEIDVFIRLTRHLPLIDVGGNVGVVTLQAAMQGRPVVVVEPIPENALRLCRAVLDFGHAHLVHVIQNAVSSSEGNVTLAMDNPKAVTHYEVQRTKHWGHGRVVAYSMFLDRLLDILPFKKAVLKIDVESHEGHVISGATKLFQEIDIPLVWMEWGHAMKKSKYGGPFIIDFMERRNMVPYNMMSNTRLHKDQYRKWPFSVLWRRVDTPL